MRHKRQLWACCTGSGRNSLGGVREALSLPLLLALAPVCVFEIDSRMHKRPLMHDCLRRDYKIANSAAIL